jgi:hypothetical protein
VEKNVNLDTVYKAILAVLDKGGFSIKRKKIKQRIVEAVFEAYKEFSLGKIYIIGDDNDFSVFLEWETRVSIIYGIYRYSTTLLSYFHLSKQGRRNSGKAWQRLSEIIPIIIEELHKGVLNWFSSDYYIVQFFKYAANKLEDSRL